MKEKRPLPLVAIFGAVAAANAARAMQRLLDDDCVARPPTPGCAVGARCLPCRQAGRG